MNNTVLFEPDRSLPEIDLAPVRIPERSQLISLAPKGLDTDEVESIWSYLHRLADAHAIRFVDLFLQFFVRYSRELLGSRCRSGELFRDWQNLVEAIHGATFGTRVAHLIERLTLRTGLERLTLVPVCRTAGLNVHLRKDQAWCRECLAEDDEPYGRLIWTISGVTHCPKHGTPLETLCCECKKPQKLFSGRSDILKCMRCGSPRNVFADPELGITPQNDDFDYWSSKQVGALLSWASRGDLETRHIDVRSHNLLLSSQMREIGGIVVLSRILGIGRTTAHSWLRDGRSIPLASALKWAWVVSIDLNRLYSAKLNANDLRFRPLPEEKAKRTKPKRRPPVPNDSTALYLAALRLASANPFSAPRVPDLEEASKIHERHAAFRDPNFLRLISQLRKRERLFRTKERIWRTIGDVHAAALKTIDVGERLGRGSVRSHMEQPGYLGGHLARSYLRWFKRRRYSGDLSVLRPKHIPVDVRAYWSLQKAQE